ncbi:MAG: arsenate reductase (glutaredoxin) [Candidatus Methylomirabilis sp.]|nr:arsenate reductase (glutaredoxin) [Deltaproteobacteria bacterium]
MSVEIWHNPRCGKSRATLKLLEEKGLAPKVRLYLEDPPTRKELEEAVARLGIEATALLRTGEAEYKALVQKHGKPDAKAALDWMARHPILIERPVVVKGKKARLGRPPENVLEIL